MFINKCKGLLIIVATLTIFLVAQGTLSAHAENPYQLLWSHIYGGKNNGSANFVGHTTDGGYIITGFTDSSDNLSHLYLLKTDASGNMQWDRSYGNMGLTVGYSVTATDDGGYVVSGITNSAGSGGIDVYLLKTDSLGNPLWNNTFGGLANDFGYSIARTADGGFVIAGGTYSFGNGDDEDIYLVRTDSNGNLIWEKRFGGNQKDVAHYVSQTPDGGFIITGSTKSFGNQGGDSLGNGAEDLYLIKVDSGGNELWNRTYGGTNYDDGFYILQTVDGGYAIAGQTKSFGNGSTDAYMVKTDANGTLQWNKTYGGTADDAAFSIAPTSDYGYLLAGTTYSTKTGNAKMYAVKTDSSGTEQWNQYYGGPNSELGYAMVPSNNNSFIIAGSTTSTTDGHSKVLLIKIGEQSNTSPVPSLGSKPTPSGETPISSIALIMLGFFTSAMLLLRRR